MDQGANRSTPRCPTRSRRAGPGRCLRSSPDRDRRSGSQAHARPCHVSRTIARRSPACSRTHTPRRAPGAVRAPIRTARRRLVAGPAPRRARTRANRDPRESRRRTPDGFAHGRGPRSGEAPASRSARPGPRPRSRWPRDQDAGSRSAPARSASSRRAQSTSSDLARSRSWASSARVAAMSRR